MKLASFMRHVRTIDLIEELKITPICLGKEIAREKERVEVDRSKICADGKESGGVRKGKSSRDKRNPTYACLF